MDGWTTKQRATREDPTIGTSHLLLLLASIAGLGGVALLMLASSHGQDRIAALLGVLSVAGSWITIHTVYTSGYAAAYYSDTEGASTSTRRSRRGTPTSRTSGSRWA